MNLLGKVFGNILFLLVTMLLCHAVYACVSVKAAVQSADDVAAQLLCAQSKAELQGISVEQARDAYCSTRDTWRPWLDAALQARRMGAALAAGTTPPVGPDCPPGGLLPAYPPTVHPGPKDAPAGGTGAR